MAHQALQAERFVAGDGFSKRDVQQLVWERAAYRMKICPTELSISASSGAAI